MYMRLLELRVKPEGLELARNYYQDTVLPRIRTMPGCRFALLVQNRLDPNDLISMTLWEQRQDAETYQQSPVYEQMIAEFSDFLAESSVWKVQLSQNLELEYRPETQEPVIQSYPVSARKKLAKPENCQSKALFVRIVSHKIQPGKMDEFRALYRKILIPALEKIRGCCAAYLMENMENGEEVISITVWENQRAAEEYEQSGRFQELIDRVKHCYTRLFQWKMSLAREGDKQARTSDDMRIDHYQIVSGEEFN